MIVSLTLPAIIYGTYTISAYMYMDMYSYRVLLYIDFPTNCGFSSPDVSEVHVILMATLAAAVISPFSAAEIAPANSVSHDTAGLPNLLLASSIPFSCPGIPNDLTPIHGVQYCINYLITR